MRTSRIEAFSDGVFAIAITLLVLEIRVPDDMATLGSELRGLWPSYLGYVISFLLIGLIWANHHAMFDGIERTDRTLLFLNTLLLMNVAFLPFVTGVVAQALRDGGTHGERIAVVLYGGTLVVGGIFFNAIWLWASHAGLHGPDVPVEDTRRMGLRFLAGPALYLAGTLVGLVVPLAALAVFALLIVFYWLPARTSTTGDPGVTAG